jgi:nicotinamide-nucleotide amidase
MSLEKAIGTLLREKGWSLSIAESCTGGLISDRITNISGSSDYFEGGIVSYSNRAKAMVLSIPMRVIERYGAVSPQVARRMAQSVRKVFRTTFGLSTTGVAGPTGGTKKTPVGRIFIAVSDGKRTLVSMETFKGMRRKIKKQATERSLRVLHDFLLEKAQSA